MFKKAFHVIFTLCGMLLGLGVAQALAEWIKSYKVFLEKNDKYNTTFIDVGDGIAISRKVD